jgi:hypothetical protein
MAYTFGEVIETSANNTVAAHELQNRALAGSALAYIMLTTWVDETMDSKGAREVIKTYGVEAGLSKDIWANYLPKVTKAADKVVANYGDHDDLNAVRHADDAETALDLFVAFMASLDVVRPYHWTVWGNQKSAGKREEVSKVDTKKATALLAAMGKSNATPTVERKIAPTEEAQREAATVAALKLDDVVAFVKALDDKDSLNLLAVALNERLVAMAKVDLEAREAETVSTPVVSEEVKTSRRRRNAA